MFFMLYFCSIFSSFWIIEEILASGAFLGFLRFWKNSEGCSIEVLLELVWSLGMGLSLLGLALLSFFFVAEE